MKRPFFVLGAAALAARLVIGCSPFLASDPPADDAGDPPSGLDAGASPDGDLREASPRDSGGPDIPDVVSECRTVVFEGFEDPSYGDRWLHASSGSGAMAPSQEAHTGQAALRFSTLDANAFVHLATASLGGDCALTVDFWVMRKTDNSQNQGGVVLFELTAPDRVRQLRQFGTFLHLDHETADATTPEPKELSKSFDGDTYHHIVIRYELSGKMTIKVDASGEYTLPGNGPSAVATQLRFGVLGSTGAAGSRELSFDDILIY